MKAFLDRPIEGDWPYVWVDATYLKVRQAGRIVSVAVTIAVGVNGDGRREVPAMTIFLLTLPRLDIRRLSRFFWGRYDGGCGADAREAITTT